MKVNSVRYELARMSELAEYLQSVHSHELAKRATIEISEENLARNPRRMVIEGFMRTTKDFLADLFQEIVERNSSNYPSLETRIPFVAYESATGRETYP